MNRTVEEAKEMAKEAVRDRKNLNRTLRTIQTCDNFRTYKEVTMATSQEVSRPAA